MQPDEEAHLYERSSRMLQSIMSVIYNQTCNYDKVDENNTSNFSSDVNHEKKSLGEQFIK